MPAAVAMSSIVVLRKPWLAKHPYAATRIRLTRDSDTLTTVAQAVSPSTPSRSSGTAEWWPRQLDAHGQGPGRRQGEHGPLQQAGQVAPADRQHGYAHRGQHRNHDPGGHP